MISYIIGTVTEKGTDYIIIESNNIGYYLQVSAITSSYIQEDIEVKIYTHMIVKEDDLRLIGFFDLTEKNMYILLSSVSKIGAKTALSMLSTYIPEDIAKLIKNGDYTSLSKIPGIGKKTAERIILELKDKVDEFIFSENTNVEIKLDNTENELFDNAVEALTMLNFANKEAKNAVKTVLNKNKDITLEDLIRKSLSIIKTL